MDDTAYIAAFREEVRFCPAFVLQQAQRLFTERTGESGGSVTATAHAPPFVIGCERLFRFQLYRMAQRATRQCGVKLQLVLRCEMTADEAALLVVSANEAERFSMPVRLPQSSTQSGGAARYRVLAADDDPLSRKILASLLAKLGCDVILANSGHAAVELARGERFDLILLDGFMPGLDGFEVALRIRQSTHPGRHTPIIAVTGSATDEHVKQGTAAGIDDFLAKPFGQEQLRTILERWTSVCRFPASGHPRN